MITNKGRELLREWRFHVVDTRVDDVAAVYNEKQDADNFARISNAAFEGRYVVVDTLEDTDHGTP